MVFHARTVPSLGVVFAALALGACGQKGAAGMGGPPGAPEVTVVTLKAEAVPLVRELPGRTSAILIAEVRPQVTGIVKRRLFTEGAYVKAGEVLYQLDDAIYRAQYNTAQAALAKAQAAVEVSRAKANRAAELVKTHAISTQDNDDAVAALRQAEADIASAQAAVQTSSVNLSYARITAPISGQIGKSSVTQGALVTANQAAPLAVVQQLDPIYVDVTQPSSEWLHLRQNIDAGRVTTVSSGAPVAISLENGIRYEHDGVLQFEDVTVDPTTGSFLLRAIVPNPKSVLRPGMYVKALLVEGVQKQGVLAPQQGIMRDPKGDATALVVGADGKIQPRVVHVTRTIGDKWLVDDGLGAGDRLVVEGLQKVQPGMSVKPVEAKTAASPAPASTH